ncbi:hypothetical protein NVP1167O_25 [Vibrio phage 1.167.O._10N.261.51.F2]|nr:hypothetical protein NVP1167O_25 [Vibrio phage 1.167.O._10N.261.51.F2]
MACSDYPTQQTAKTFKLDAETVNEVVTSSDDRTSPASDGETKLTLAGIENLAEEQRDQFDETFTAQFAYKRIGNISDYAGQSLAETDKLNAYQYPDDSGEWYGPIQSQVFPITIPVNPSTDNGWALVNAVTTDSIGLLTNYQSASVADMVAGNPVAIDIGDTCLVSGTVYIRRSTANSDIRDFEALTPIYASGFHPFDGTDATPSLLSMALISDDKNVIFPNGGSVILTQELNFAKAKSVDFGRIVVNCDFSDTDRPITIGATTVTEVGELTSELSKLSTTITLSDVTNVVRGSMLSIYNPVDYSFSGFRASYRQGEFQFVSSISGNDVTIDASTIETYPSGTKIYLIDTTTTKLTGELTVNNTGAYSVGYGLRVMSNVNADYAGLKVSLNNSTHALSLDRNVGCFGSSMIAWQRSVTTSGLDYGLVQGSCQSNTFEGSFHAERHGSATGGDGSAGSVVNRFLTVRGRITTTGEGSVQAADFHGNTEFCRYGGYLEGASLGGNASTIEEGSVVVSPKADLPSLAYSELKSTKHTAKNVTVICYGDPGSRGAIDVGGNSDVVTEFTTIGGAFDFRGCHIESPDKQSHLVAVRNRGATVDFDILLDGMTIDAQNAATLIACSAVSGSEPNLVSLYNTPQNLSISASGDKVLGWEKFGRVRFTLDTSTNRMNASVSYDYPFPLGRVPLVTSCCSRSVIGSELIQSVAVSPDTNSIDVRIATRDGSNFSSSVDVDVRWKAEMVESSTVVTVP